MTKTRLIDKHSKNLPKQSKKHISIVNSKTAGASQQ